MTHGRLDSHTRCQTSDVLSAWRNDVWAHEKGLWMGTRIAASDLTWLLMDRPNNLMHVHGLLTFDELPEWEALRDAIFERVVTKYRLLSQVAIQQDGH